MITPTRYESVGCDDGRFISPKEFINAPLYNNENENENEDDDEWQLHL